MVIWLIGLSGAGKTTIGREVYRIWKQQAPHTVLVDGDEIRAIFGHTGEEAYTIEGRRTNAARITAICKWLDSQGINVVCPVLSIFQENRDANRTDFSHYFEVYIQTGMDELIRRDSKGLYAGALDGTRRFVVGVDIPFIPPQNPDMTLKNDYPYLDIHQAALNILRRAGALEA